MRTDRRKMMVGWSSNYERLEYISNANGGYIVTNLYLTSKSTLKMKVGIVTKQVTSFCGSSEKFNEVEGYTALNALGLGISQNAIGFRAFWGSGDIKTISEGDMYPYQGCLDLSYPSVEVGKVYDLEIADNFAKVNGEKVLNLLKLDFKTKYPFSIFELSRSEPFISCIPKKIYDLEIGGDVMAHFIPVKRKSDGMIGMYDTVGRKFYTSPNGVPFVGG